MSSLLYRSLLRPGKDAVIATRRNQGLWLCLTRLASISPTISTRTLAQVRSDREAFSEVWFTASGPYQQAPEESAAKAHEAPPDERTLKLGKSK